MIDTFVYGWNRKVKRKRNKPYNHRDCVAMQSRWLYASFRLLCLASLLCNLHNGDFGVAHVGRGRRRDGEDFVVLLNNDENEKNALCLLFLVVFCDKMYFSKGSLNVDVPIALQSRGLSLPSLYDRIGGKTGDRVGGWNNTLIHRFFVSGQSSQKHRLRATNAVSYYVMPNGILIGHSFCRFFVSIGEGRFAEPKAAIKILSRWRKNHVEL